MYLSQAWILTICKDDYRFASTVQEIVAKHKYVKVQSQVGVTQKPKYLPNTDELFHTAFNGSWIENIPIDITEHHEQSTLKKEEFTVADWVHHGQEAQQLRVHA